MGNIGNMNKALNPKPFGLPIQVGLIFDVSNDVLDKLFTFDNQKNFFNNFFSVFDGEILALLNGNGIIPYYDFNQLLISAIKYLNDENTISSKKKEININYKKNLFDEKFLYIIVKKLKYIQKSFEFIHSRNVFKNYLTLKEILLKHYKTFSLNLFKKFDNFISKPSSIYLSIIKLFEVFKKFYYKSKNKYIIIISDGNSKEKEEDINDLITESEEMNITIVTLLLTKENNNINAFYNEFPNNIKKESKNLFKISSKVNYKNPFAHYYIKKNWNFPRNGQGNLLFKANIDRLIESNTFANDLNEIRNEGLNIQIGDLHYDNFIKFKYQFMTKNQIFGTCWANAYSTAIFLTIKRIVGRLIESFETIREKLLKFASVSYDDGGDINNEKVKIFFENQRIHFSEVNEEEARNCIMKGRFVVCNFALANQQWTNLSKFYQWNRRGILDENTINANCQKESEPTDGGHAVLLIEVGENYLKFLNSWGSDFADGGTFKVKDINALTSINGIEPKFYDIFFYEKDLIKEETEFYAKNIDFIREYLSSFDNISIEQIKNHLNNLYDSLYTCKNCTIQLKLDKFKIYKKNGLYEMKCPVCNLSSIARGVLREFLILRDFMYDGNKDFDINFKENKYLHIDRLKLHNGIIVKNDSDECSIGREKLIQLNNNKNIYSIDSPFKHKVNGVISLGNGYLTAFSSDKILIFELLREISLLIMKTFPKDKILSICDLKLGNKNLIAIGGKKLNIYAINYSRRNLEPIPLRANMENENITKIILIEENIQDILKKIVVSDKNGNICIYVIKNNNNNNIIISFSFKAKCHECYVNTILYMPDEKLLVSRSYKDETLKIWEIQDNGLNRVFKFGPCTSTKHNTSLLDMNGNLLIGEEFSIRVFQHENKTITNIYFYYDEEFGEIFTIRPLKNNYFLAGRSYGYCSLFLLREKSIRKINIFRNNNLSVSKTINDYKDDQFYITDIYVKETSRDTGYILISSKDKTLKIYKYEFHDQIS